MNDILSILSGGASGAILVWVFREWISERLKQSIRHEYSLELEKYKTELNEKVLDLDHKSKIDQLRTSLFFDHQREAYEAILKKISEVNHEWKKKSGVYDCYEDYTEIKKGISRELLDSLKDLYYEKQLYFDDNCSLVMTMLFETYMQSISEKDVMMAEIPVRDVNQIYNNIVYLKSRTYSIFRESFGVSSDSGALNEVALFASARLVNSYAFSDVGNPISTNLKIDPQSRAANIVATAENNKKEIIVKLYAIRNYLKEKGGGYYNCKYLAETCLKIMDSNNYK